MDNKLEKRKKLLRWLSVLPVGFTTFFISDWVMRLLALFVVFPMKLLEDIFGASFLSRFIDNFFIHIFGIDFITTATVIITNLVIGYAVTFVVVMISPADKKRMASVAAAVYLFLIGGAFFAGVTNSGFVAEYILADIFLVVGIINARRVFMKQAVVETERYEAIVLNYALPIFTVSLLFTAVMVVFLI